MSTYKHMKSKDSIQNFLPFLPYSVLRTLTQPEALQAMPQLETFTSAVLVAEIKNFYDQSLRFRSFNTDSQFNEHLCTLSQAFLELLTKHIHRFGGDIIQFLGNSLIAVWPRKCIASTGDFKDDEDTGIIIARKATQCALEIRNEAEKLFDKKTEIFMGVGFGQCGILHVGGIKHRSEYFLIGEGLNTALKALRLATSDQSVIISWNLWNLVDRFFLCDPLKNFLESEKAVRYIFGTGTRSSYNTVELRDLLPQDKIRQLQTQIKGYTMPHLRPYIKRHLDQETWEHRRLTIMVLNIEMDYEVTQSPTLLVIQKMVEIIQLETYKLEGSFLKLISYEGGFTVVCSWGLPHLSHLDDAARAVLAALNIQKAIYRFARLIAGLDINPPVHIGLCTGNCFLGVLGTDRKELIMLGETMERAFLYMQTATKLYGKIYVDLETKQEAGKWIEFRYIEDIEFGHKLTNQPTFEPIDPVIQEDADLAWQKQPLRLMRKLRLHPSPWRLDYNNDYQHNYTNIKNFNAITPMILEDFAQYILSPEDQLFTLAVVGPPGSGKSLFARSLLIQTINESRRLLEARNEDSDILTRLHVSICSCDADKGLKFCGAWIPIIKEMLSIYTETTNKTQIGLVNQLLIQQHQGLQGYIRIVEDLIGVKPLQRKVTQKQLDLDWLHPEYPEEVKDSLISLLHDLITAMVQQLKNQVIFCVFIDNFSQADLYSWLLLDLLLSQNESLILILCLSSNPHPTSNDSRLNLQLTNPDAQTFYNSRLQPFELAIFNLVELEPILDLSEMILEQAQAYKHEFTESIELWTERIEKRNTVKTDQGQKEIRARLRRKFQVDDQIRYIDQVITDEAGRRARGNPQIGCDTISQWLMRERLRLREGGRLEVGTKGIAMMKTGNWNGVEVAWLAQKHTMTTLEETFMNANLPSDLSLSLVRLLRFCSVLGHTFTMQQLNSTYNDQAYSVSILLETLDNLALIELLYTDSQDSLYRFTLPYLRDTIYQSLPRQILNTLITPVITYIQSHVIYNWQTDFDFQVEQAMLLQYLLEAEGVELELKLSNKSREALRIKRVNAAMIQQQDIIKEGELGMEKSGGKGIRRIVIVTRGKVRIMDEEAVVCKEIGMEQILKAKPNKSNVQMEVSMSMNKSMNKSVSLNDSTLLNRRLYCFQIQCNEYLSNGSLKLKPKTFVFLAQSKRDGEDWVGIIEYLRTKAHVDQFQNKFGHSKIPIGNEMLPPINSKNKITSQPAHKFGSELHRQLKLGHAHHSHQKFDLQTFRNQKQKKYEPKQQENSEAILAIKNQLAAFYNITKAQFLTHMQVNALKADDFYEQSTGLDDIDPYIPVEEILSGVNFVKTIETNELVSKDNQSSDSEDSQQQIKSETQLIQNPNPILEKESIKDQRRKTAFEQPQLFNLRKSGIIQLNRSRLTTMRKPKHQSANFEHQAETSDQEADSDNPPQFIRELDEQSEEELTELFIEEQYTRIPRIDLPLQFNFEDSNEIMQVVSIKNDINEKQTRIKRKLLMLHPKIKEIEDYASDNEYPIDDDELNYYSVQPVQHIRQEIDKAQQYLEGGINTQQHHQKNPLLREKSAALAKLLNHKTKREQKSSAIKQENNREGRKMQPSNSIAQLQMMQEQVLQGRSRSREQQHQIINKRKAKLQPRIYQQTPSQKYLEGWMAREASIKKLLITEILNDAEDDYSEYQESFDQEQPLTKPLIKVGHFYEPGQQVAITKDHVQFIIQGSSQECQLHIGSIVTIELDLRDLGLVKAFVLAYDQKVLAIIPRDSIQPIDQPIEEQPSTYQQPSLMRTPSSMFMEFIPRQLSIHHLMSTAHLPSISEANSPTSSSGTGRSQHYEQHQHAAEENKYHLIDRGHEDTLQQSVEALPDTPVHVKQLLKVQERRKKREQERGSTVEFKPPTQSNAVGLKMMERRKMRTMKFDKGRNEL